MGFLGNIFPFSFEVTFVKRRRKTVRTPQRRKKEDGREGNNNDASEGHRRHYLDEMTETSPSDGRYVPAAATPSYGATTATIATPRKTSLSSTTATGLYCPPRVKLNLHVTARQWARLHSYFLLAACALLAVATLFVFIPIHQKQLDALEKRRRASIGEKENGGGGGGGEDSNSLMDDDIYIDVKRNGRIAQDKQSDKKSRTTSKGEEEEEGGDAATPTFSSSSRLLMSDDQRTRAVEESSILFTSLLNAVLQGPAQSRERSLRIRERNWWPRTIVAWCYLLSAMAFVVVDVLEAWWLWTQVKPRASLFVDDVPSSMEDDDDEAKEDKEDIHHHPTSSRSSRSSSVMMTNSSSKTTATERSPLTSSVVGITGGYGGTVAFGDDADEDDAQDAPSTADETKNSNSRGVSIFQEMRNTAKRMRLEKEEASSSAARATAAKTLATLLPSGGKRGVYGEDINDCELDEMLPNSPVYPLSMFARKRDRQIVKALRVSCILSLITALIDSFCFFVYCPQVQQLLAFLTRICASAIGISFGSVAGGHTKSSVVNIGAFLSDFLLFWAERFLVVGFICTILSLVGRVYRRLCLETERTARVVRYPPFSFF